MVRMTSVYISDELENELKKFCLTPMEAIKLGVEAKAKSEDSFSLYVIKNYFDMTTLYIDRLEKQRVAIQQELLKQVEKNNG